MRGGGARARAGVVRGAMSMVQANTGTTASMGKTGEPGKALTAGGGRRRGAAGGGGQRGKSGGRRGGQVGRVGAGGSAGRARGAARAAAARGGGAGHEPAWKSGRWRWWRRGAARGAMT